MKCKAIPNAPSTEVFNQLMISFQFQFIERKETLAIQPRSVIYSVSSCGTKRIISTTHLLHVRLVKILVRNMPVIDNYFGLLTKLVMHQHHSSISQAEQNLREWCGCRRCGGSGTPLPPAKCKNGSKQIQDKSINIHRKNVHGKHAVSGYLFQLY